MRYIITKALFISSFFLLGLLLSQCQWSRDQGANLEPLHIQIQGIEHIQLAGVDIDREKDMDDFSVKDGLIMASAHAKGKFICSFDLILNVQNPNLNLKNQSGVYATITDLSWQLYWDQKRSAQGAMPRPVSIAPSTDGKHTVVRVPIDWNFSKTFPKTPYEELVKRALMFSKSLQWPKELEFQLHYKARSDFGPLPKSDPIERIAKTS